MIKTKTCTTIVTGPSAAAREDAIADHINTVVACGTDPAIRRTYGCANGAIAVLLEGIPDGSERFSGLQQQSDITLLPVVRIAPGCLCCTGNLTMRVHLNRLLRARPAQLYIGVSPGTHLSTLQDFLSHAPYDDLLVLSGIMHAV